MARNGNAITLKEEFYQQNIRTLDDFHQFIVNTPDKRHNFGMVHPSSMHNLLLRYWLAAGGIDPDRDVNLMTIPPAQMVVDLKAGTIDGYCVGEPWNYRAAREGKGFTIASDLGIWNGHPGKVLGVREDWATAYPNTHVALVKALLEACQYCADPQNVHEIRHLLSQREYLGMKAEYITIADPLNDTEAHDPHQEFAHPQFFGKGVNRPSRTEQLWIITQMARWGITPFPRNWVEILERVCRLGTFSTASRELGLDVDYTRSQIELFDGVKFNTEDPIGYLNNLPIKRPISVAEIILNS
jgi:bicarbonate transport system ATP-binding protein